MTLVQPGTQTDTLGETRDHVEAQVERNSIPRIAIVESEVEMHQLMQMTLQTGGYTDVQFFTYGPTFLEVFRQQPFDIVIVNHALPDMDGQEIVDELVKLHPDHKPVIIMMGALSADNLKLHHIRSFLQRDIRGFISMPFSSQEFIGKIQEIWEARTREP
jgi:CheY-like chemotaxis protein